MVCIARPAIVGRGRSLPRRTYQRNDFAFVTPVNAEVFGIDCNHPVFGIYLAHSNKTQVGQIRRPILVSLRESSKLQQVIVTIE